MSYIGTVCLLILLCSTAQLHPLFLSHRWHWKRLVLYSAVSLFGIIPFIHWCVVSSHETVMVFNIMPPTGSQQYHLLYLFCSYFILKYSFSIYSDPLELFFMQQDFPKNFSQVFGICVFSCIFVLFLLSGHVDLFGASHQWWHILTALALVWWHLAAVELFLYRVTTSCPMTEKHV